MEDAEGRTQLHTSINKYHLFPISCPWKLLEKTEVAGVTLQGLFWASKFSPDTTVSLPSNHMLHLQNLPIAVEVLF